MPVALILPSANLPLVDDAMLLSWTRLILLAAFWLAAFFVARRRGLHLEVAAAGLLALACLGFYWQIFFNGAWMPPGGGDLASFLWPTYSFAARSLKAGVLPLWNPHLYAGAPFVADNQSGLFYPVNALLFLLAPTLTYEMLELLSVGHVWWAGVGTYWLLRDMGARRAPALAGALAFMFSDLFVTHFGNTNLIAVAAWLPWVFGLFRRALIARRGSYRHALAAGALWGVAALAGHMQITLFIGLWLGGYAVYRAALEAQCVRKAGWRGITRPLALAVLSGAVMLGLAALALIPAYEMARYTGRAALPYEEAARYSLPPAGWLGLLIPSLFGRGAGAWTPWERVEVGYIGILPLVLAALVWALRRRGRPRPGNGDELFFGLAAAAALILAMGGYSTLHGWVYRFVPGFGQLRAPARAIVLFDFGVALLAGLALDAWLSGLARRARRALRAAAGGLAWLGVGIAAAGLPMAYFMVSMARGDAGLVNRNVQVLNGIVVAIGLSGASALLTLARAGRWLTPRASVWLALGLIALDLFTLGSSVDVEPEDPTVGFQHPRIVSFLRDQNDLFRIQAIASRWQPDAALMHGLYDVGGIYNPLSLGAYQTYVGGMGNRGSPLYNALNIKYVLADKGQPPGDARFVPVLDDDPQIDVYLNTAALPRAWLVGRSLVVADGRPAWDAIHTPGFDPASTVVVEGGTRLDGTIPPGGARLVIEHYGTNDLRLGATTSVPAYLVLSEMYYPGWRAWVDGQPTPVLPADFALRAVFLEPGTHDVYLAFQPVAWILGLAISAATGLGLTAVAVVSWRSRRTKSRPSGGY